MKRTRLDVKRLPGFVARIALAVILGGFVTATAALVAIDAKDWPSSRALWHSLFAG